MNSLKKLITIMAPAYNEELIIDTLHQRLAKLADSEPKYDFEFLFVNDGSKDSTLDKIKKLSKEDDRVSFVNLSRNFGQEVAMLAGIDHASGDAVVVIDADLQDPPELIPEMIRCWEAGYDDVYARRNSRAGETWLKKATSSAFYKILQKTTRVPLQQDTGNFRLLDKRCVEALRQLRESQRYTKGMFSWIGFKKKEIRYDRDPRAAGTTKWSYPKLIELAIEGITSFTVAPLKVATILGAVVSLFAFIYILVIVVRTLLFGADVAGYPSLMAAILFMGGVQLLSLGIIGEYVGRIFNETKNRPAYFVEAYHRGDKSSSSKS